jgi:hypothetical protein
VGLPSRLGGLFSRDARLKDPLVGRLPEMPVPLFEAGWFVAGLEEWGAFVADEEGVKLYSWTPVRSRGDRELGGIAQYELRFSFPHGAVAALDEDQLSRLTEVTQVVVLLSDADAAARWLMTKTRRLEDLEGQEVDGHLYGKVDVDITLTGLGDEAAVVVAHTEVGRAGTPSCETYINFRAGRLFGSVGASTYKELEVRPQLRELAEAFLSRMESILAGRPLTVRPVARSSGKRPGRSSSPARPTHGHGRDARRARRPRAASGRHEIIGGVAGLAIWFGWPSAVVVFFAHRWGYPVHLGRRRGRRAGDRPRVRRLRRLRLRCDGLGPVDGSGTHIG